VFPSDTDTYEGVKDDVFEPFNEQDCPLNGNSNLFDDYNQGDLQLTKAEEKAAKKAAKAEKKAAKAEMRAAKKAAKAAKKAAKGQN